MLQRGCTAYHTPLTRTTKTVTASTSEGRNAMANASNTNAPTQFIETKLEKYAYRRFGKGNGLPLFCLQHFTGTLDNWDPAVTDPLAVGREVILFESAGLGRSTGQAPENISRMAAHALAFVDALGLKRLDILGYSLGGMVAQQVVLERPSLVHKMLLVATAPEGGEDIMHMEKPELRKITEDPNMPGREKLVKLFFAPSESSQAAGEAFAARIAERKQDGEPLAETILPANGESCDVLDTHRPDGSKHLNLLFPH